MSPVDATQAEQLAQDYLRTHPRATDPVLTAVEEREQCFVAYWTTARFLQTRAVADSQGPGVGPLVIPKDGSEPQYTGSQALDVELHRLGLGPAPSAQGPAWD
jgi:hypothetical protein